MSEKLVKNSEYRSFIQEVKQRIQSAQIKAAISDLITIVLGAS
jgi:hypothetical protein